MRRPYSSPISLQSVTSYERYERTLVDCRVWQWRQQERCPPMPLVDPVLVIVDRSTEAEAGSDADAVAAQATCDVALTQTTRELLTLARQLGTPMIVHCDQRRPSAAASGLAALARRLSPRAILCTSDPVSENVAARTAVRLEAGIVTDIAGVSVEHGAIYAIQYAAGGTCRIATELRGPTPIVTVRSGAFRAIPQSATADIEHIYIELDSSDDPAEVPVREPRIRRRTRERDSERELLLDEADVVVAGGRGVGSAEGFSLLARVAYALGGCLGGTHTARELGWCPDHARISVPGTQVRPLLYLAGGVSGSVRHRAAIRRARTVVAIDTDPTAPIFRDADFGIVGDLHQVLPEFLDELARRAETQGHDATTPTSTQLSTQPASPESAEA